ncbi:conserved hypothetical protein [Planktothrix serta PCC 8927]|uniref:Uncharacterized protein n=1 Tax=Planktothrix serta PCC 8927 TaxID=671068 RepID=A0A7Z9DXX5_9CYAN|nr:hypothetical protein [Planktothrix serta]VXD17599.1 conserved hypothetical protein [Planktothrix serta PCC 8927]
MSLSPEVQIALEIQKGIRQAEDELVQAIEKALDSKKYGNLEESQFRNLVRVAETTDSPEVIKNFIRYQVGRDTKWGRGKDSLAEIIINDINAKTKEKAEAIAKQAKTQDIKSIHIELIRRYLGYGARHLKYLREGKV